MLAPSCCYFQCTHSQRNKKGPSPQFPTTKNTKVSSMPLRAHRRSDYLHNVPYNVRQYFATPRWIQNPQKYRALVAHLVVHQVRLKYPTLDGWAVVVNGFNIYKFEELKADVVKSLSLGEFLQHLYVWKRHRYCAALRVGPHVPFCDYLSQH